MTAEFNGSGVMAQVSQKTLWGVKLLQHSTIPLQPLLRFRSLPSNFATLLESVEEQTSWAIAHLY